MPTVPSSHQGDLVVSGHLSANSMTIPAGAVGNSNVAAGSTGNFVAATKLQQLIHKHIGDASGVDASTYTKTIHVARKPGSVVSFKAGSKTVAGAATTVVADLKKNGTTILSATITLDNTSVAYTLYSGTISTADYVAGDWFEVTFTLTGTNEPQGVTAELVCLEDPA